jgi:hypothetical protein
MSKKILTFLICLLNVFLTFAGDSYNSLNNQLTIDKVALGKTVYSNVVVTVGGVISIGSNSAYGDIDIYDPTNNQLTIQTVSVGDKTYNNVVITVGNVLTVGSSDPLTDPIVNISFDNSMIKLGESATLSWNATNANNCQANGGSVIDVTNGSNVLSDSSLANAGIPFLSLPNVGNVIDSAIPVQQNGTFDALSDWYLSVYPKINNPVNLGVNDWTSSTGAKPTKGSLIVTPLRPQYYIFAITCTNPSSSTTQYAVLTVYGMSPTDGIENSQNDIYINKPQQSMIQFGPSLYFRDPIVSLSTNLIVPQLPSLPTSAQLAIPNTVVAIWPGLISGTGPSLLQPVLAFDDFNNFSSWHIISAYNYGTGQTNGNMTSNVNPGDKLSMTMILNPNNNNWTITVLDLNTNQGSTLVQNLNGTPQMYAQFRLELWNGMNYKNQITFTNTVIKLTDSDLATNKKSCTIGGLMDYSSATTSPPHIDASGLICTIDSIVVNQN